MLVQKVDDGWGRLVSRETDVEYFDAKFVRNLPGRIVGLRQSPLHEQVPHMRERQRASIVSVHMNNMKATSGGKSYGQSMRKRFAAQIREIRRMHDRSN